MFQTIRRREQISWRVEELIDSLFAKLPVFLALLVLVFSVLGIITLLSAMVLFGINLFQRVISLWPHFGI